MSVSASYFTIRRTLQEDVYKKDSKNYLSTSPLNGFLVSHKIVFYEKKNPSPASTVDSVHDCESRCIEFESRPGHIPSMEIDREIISMVILPFPLIQEGQLSMAKVRALNTGTV